MPKSPGVRLDLFLVMSGRVQSMSSCARSIIEGKTSSSQGVCHHAFKSALLSGAVNLEKQGINTQRMQQCLENIHRMKLWKPTSTDADPVINGKFDSRLCEYGINGPLVDWVVFYHENS